MSRLAVSAKFAAEIGRYEATMMEEALKTHKETTFGWVLALQQLAAVISARLDRLARKQAIEATQAASRRHLAPR